MKVYIELERYGSIETRGVDAKNQKEAAESVAFFGRQYPVRRVLNEQGQDITEMFREDIDATTGTIDLSDVPTGRETEQEEDDDEE